jgi:hypothetical protein
MRSPPIENSGITEVRNWKLRKKLERLPGELTHYP